MVVDLKGTGFTLTDRKTGVLFDFFANGKPHQMPWTATDSETGWLVLDRNGDRLINNGAEMFSNVAPQPSSGPRSKIGFRALAVYDQSSNGGNGDGMIDRADAVFSSLLVWVDKNHNGISEPGELLTMQQAGIQSISLRYETSSWRDVYGNLFRNRSRIVFAGGKSRPDQYIYDVTLDAGAGGSNLPKRPKR